MIQNKTFLIIGFGRLFQVLIAFATIKFVTNYLSQENVAYYFLIMTILNCFGLALISPVGQYINRKLHEWQDQQVVLNRFVVLASYVLGVSLFAIPTMFIAMRGFGLFPSLSALQMAIVVTAGVFFNTAITTIVPAFNMFDYRKSFVVFTSLWLFFSLLISVSLVTLFGESVLLWFLGQILSQAIFSIIAILVLKQFLREKIDWKRAFHVANKEDFTKVLHFSLPLVLSTALMWFVTDGFRLIIERRLGLEYLALFSVGFAIATRFSYAIESIVQQVYLPTYYKNINNESFVQRSGAWNQLTSSSLPFYLLTTILTIVLAPALLTVFSGPDYQTAIPFVICGAIFHFFRKLTSIFSLTAHSEMKTKILIVPYFLSGMCSIFGLVLFPAFTNVTIGISGFVLFISMFLQIKKTFRIDIDFKPQVMNFLLLLPLFLLLIFWDFASTYIGSIGLIISAMLYSLGFMIKSKVFNA